MSRITTLALVLVAGMATTLVVTNLQESSARGDAVLQGIVDPDGEVRARAWLMKGPEIDRPVVLDRLLQHRDQTVILAHAALEFGDLDWQPHPTLVVAAARLGDPEPLIACLWSKPPQDLPTRRELMTGVAAALADPKLQTLRDQTRDRILEAYLAGLPGSDHEILMDAMIEEGVEPPECDRLLLTLAILGTPPNDAFGASTAIIAARSIATGRLPSGHDHRDTLPGWILASPRLAPAGQAELSRRAAEDDPEARRTLAVADRERFLGSAEAVLADRTTTFERRAIAAARLLEHEHPPGDASILNLLLAGPEDIDGSVHASAGIAWLGLSGSGRQGLEARWWSSRDEAEIRSAILLTALRHHDGSLAEDDPARLEIDRLARDPEVPPRIRRTARLAAKATDRWPFDGDDLDPEVYAGRARRFKDGRLDPDAILLGLVSGDPSAERLLVSQPHSPTTDAAAFSREIAWRRVLAGLFHPEWIDAVGEPVPGGEEALRLWVDLLAAARLATPFAQSGSSGEDPTR